MDFTFSRGIVSHPNRNIMGVTYVQIDAAVNPENSGGPLLDRAGRAVGIVSMMVGSATNLGLALPVSYLVDGSDPVLVGLQTEVDQVRWGGRLKGDADDDLDEVAAARDSASRPGLVAAAVVDASAVVAVVVRMSDTRPTDSHLEFSLTRSASQLCSPSGTA